MGKVMGRYPFDPGFTGIGGEDVQRTIVPFAYRLPYSSKIANVELIGPNSDEPLDVTKINSRPPRFRASLQRASADANGNPRVRLTWHGTASHEKELFATVLVSHDKGRSWLPVEVDTTAHDIDVPLGGRKREFVKILVSNGSRSVEKTLRVGR
jgi:hypothetical protein